jgi:hypothetical protein
MLRKGECPPSWTSFDALGIHRKKRNGKAHSNRPPGPALMPGKRFRTPIAGITRSNRHVGASQPHPSEPNS